MSATTVARWLVLLQLFAISVATAAPARRILVLPLDGNVDPDRRVQLNASIARAARAGNDTVTIGDATFVDTAQAFGCDPTSPACAESVRTTLGYDELIYGTATPGPAGRTTLVVRRTGANTPASAKTIEILAESPPEHADGELVAWMGSTPRGVTNPDAPPPAEQPATPHRSNRNRNKGIILAGSGGLAFLIGLTVWSAKSSTQRDIDAAPTETLADFEALEALESRALKLAITGDLLVLSGLAIAGYGGWILYQDRRERQIAVTPMVSATSAGVVLGGRW